MKVILVDYMYLFVYVINDLTIHSWIKVSIVWKQMGLVIKGLLLHKHNIIINTRAYTHARTPPWSSCSALDHRSLLPVFQSRLGHIWRLFHLWLHFINFAGRKHLSLSSSRTHAHTHTHTCTVIPPLYAISAYIKFTIVPLFWSKFQFSERHCARGYSILVTS